MLSFEGSRSLVSENRALQFQSSVINMYLYISAIIVSLLALQLVYHLVVSRLNLPKDAKWLPGPRGTLIALYCHSDEMRRH